MSEEYILVSSVEGASILGVSKNNFYVKVRKGEIEKIPQPNKKRNALYRIKAPAAQSKKTDSKTPFVHAQNLLKDAIFRRAVPEDAQAMYELGEKIMSRSGGYGIKPEKLVPYLSIHNSEISHVLVKDNEMIGYFTIVPLTHKQLMQRMKKEIYIADFPPEELPMFVPDIPIDCFIWEVMSEPEEKAIGQYLISKMLEFFHTLGKRGVNIEGIYATASSIEGISLCRKVGMKIMDIPEVVAPQYKPFELIVRENKNWLTVKYILSAEAYKRRQAKLKRHAINPLTKSSENSLN